MNRVSRLTTQVWGLLLAGLCATSAAQNADRSARLLLETAAPLRVHQDEEPPNVLFIIVDDLNTALGSYIGSGNRPHYATASTPNLEETTTRLFISPSKTQKPMRSGQGDRCQQRHSSSSRRATKETADTLGRVTSSLLMAIIMPIPGRAHFL